jgi:hypothetical protein
MVIAVDWRRRMVHLQSAFLSTIIASSSPFPEEEEEVVDSMKQPRLGDPYGHPIHEVASLRIYLVPERAFSLCW